MKRGSTFFLRMTVILMGIPVLTLCIFGLYKLANNPVNPDYAHILYPILIGTYVSVIPFFIALSQTFKLLSHIYNSKS